MTKHFILTLAVASLLATPSFANKERRAKAQRAQTIENNTPAVERGNEHSKERKEILESLNKNQKTALQTYREKIQAHHQSNLKETNVDQTKHRETQKEAFIKGDFDKVAEVEKRIKSTHAEKMDKNQEARARAMKESFSSLSSSERETLFDLVIKDQYHAKMAKPYQR